MTDPSTVPLPGTSGAASAPAVAGVPRPERRSEPPLQETLVDLWEHLSKLVQQEIAMAKAEIGEKTQRLKTELLGSIAGAVLLLAGLLALVAAVILLLANVMAPWVAALVTGVVVGGLGYLLLSRQRPSATELTPERTLHSLKKDVQTFTEAGR